ncbi:MAG: ATP-binding protein, partial [Chloroflexota bacterium]
ILDFSKIEAGKLIIKMDAFSLQKLVLESVDLFRLKAEQKGLELGVSISSNIHQTLVGDAGRIRQILINFISNAVKFTERGRIDVDVNGTSIPGSFMLVTFTVRDTGIGIAEGTRDLLFEPFTQADDRVTRKYGGTGLGLAISRRLVDLMFGDVGLISKEGEGSSFWFSVPLKINASPADPEKIINSGKNYPPIRYVVRFQNQKPVLIADDNGFSQNLLIQQIRTFGLAGQAAASGAEVIEMIKANPNEFSLILMDINMPDLDGLSATRQIRLNESGTDRHVPIIAVTANAMVGDRAICLDAGMDDYLSKPIRLDELGKLLVKWLK